MIEPLAREVLTTVESMVCERVPERVRAGWQAVVADVDRAAREGRESAGWLAVQYLCRGDARLEQLGESEAGRERATSFVRPAPSLRLRPAPVLQSGILATVRSLGCYERPKTQHHLSLTGCVQTASERTRWEIVGTPLNLAPIARADVRRE